MSAPKIGNAKYGTSQYTKKNWYKQKEGTVTFRILPPLGDLADSGVWSKFWEVHYGYKNSAGKTRIFQSPLVMNKNKMVEVPDAALERIQNLKAQETAAKASGNAELLKQIQGLLKQFNLDKNHYLNVVDLSGNIGVLKLRHKAKKALDVEIKKLRDAGVDPLSVDNGRFFNFTRTGTGVDTTFQVTVHTESLNIQGVGLVQKEVVHKLDDALLARLSAEAAQLDKLFKRPTSEEVARIVAGGPAAVDAILDSKGAESDEGNDDDDSAPAPQAQQAAPAAQMAVAPAAVAAATAALQQVTAPAPVQQAAAVVQAPVAAPVQQTVQTTTTTPTVTPVTQSNEELLKLLGL